MELEVFRLGTGARVGGRISPLALGLNSKKFNHSKFEPAFLGIRYFEETKRLTQAWKEGGDTGEKSPSLDWMELGGTSGHVVVEPHRPLSLSFLVFVFTKTNKNICFL